MANVIESDARLGAALKQMAHHGAPKTLRITVASEAWLAEYEIRLVRVTVKPKHNGDKTSWQR